VLGAAEAVEIWLRQPERDQVRSQRERLRRLGSVQAAEGGC
jgi:hypothetical protein